MSREASVYTHTPKLPLAPTPSQHVIQEGMKFKTLQSVILYELNLNFLFASGRSSKKCLKDCSRDGSWPNFFIFFKHTRSLLYISSYAVGNSQQKGALHRVQCTGPAFPQEYPFPEQPAINKNLVSNLVSSSRNIHEGISLIVSIELLSQEISCENLDKDLNEVGWDIFYILVHTWKHSSMHIYMIYNWVKAPSWLRC